MTFAAAISSASKSARRSKGRQGVSEEETNQNDYEDIENPFNMPGEASKFDKECVQECLINTIIVVVIIIFVMLVMLICAILQWNGIGVGHGREFPWFPTKVGDGWELPWFPTNKISDH